MTAPDAHLDSPDSGDLLPPAPPAAPRGLTPTVRRRAWAEQRVRVWWLLAAAMLLIATYYAVSRTYSWSRETRLITRGQKVQAEVMGWEPNYDAPKNKVLPPDAQVDVRYAFNGQTYRPHGTLAGRKQQIYTGSHVPLFIDPADPARWTARTQPAPLAQELLPAMLLLPFAIVPFLVALVARRRVLRIYRDGEPIPARVVGAGHSAAAPLSRLVRCAVHTGGDARVVRTLLPTAKTPREGQSLWLIAPPGRPEQAVPAALFD